MGKPFVPADFDVPDGIPGPGGTLRLLNMDYLAQNNRNRSHSLPNNSRCNNDRRRPRNSSPEFEWAAFLPHYRGKEKEIDVFGKIV